MIHFLGTSYAAQTLKEGARRRGLWITDDIKEATLIFVSEDTPTNEFGNRNLIHISEYIESCARAIPIVVTSQVTPGFIRKSIEVGDTFRREIYHQAETLRIEDGLQRAMYPEMFIVGVHKYYQNLPKEYQEYLDAFECPVLKMTLEEAEFCKIAINATLISQIETTNMLSSFAEKIGADWGKIAQALRHDSRIGKYSYLTPGRWQNSKHLLRDYVTLNEIEPNKLLDAWE